MISPGANFPAWVRALAGRQPLDQGQHQHDRVFRGTRSVHAGVVGGDDAGRGQSGTIQRVGADPDHLHEPQSRSHRELRGADRSASIDKDRRVGGGCPELGFAKTRDGRDRDAGQPIRESVGEPGQCRVDQEHLVHRPILASPWAWTHRDPAFRRGPGPHRSERGQPPKAAAQLAAVALSYGRV